MSPETLFYASHAAMLAAVLILAVRVTRDMLAEEREKEKRP